MQRSSATSLLRQASGVTAAGNPSAGVSSPNQRTTRSLWVEHVIGTTFLAAEPGYQSVAVLEKGWVGGGNTACNTTDPAIELLI
jgi:hypothetical protein